MTNTIRAFLVLFFFGLLTACGGGGGGNTAMTMSPPPPVTMTTAPPVTLGFDSQEIGAFHFIGSRDRTQLIVLSVAAQGENTAFVGVNFRLERLSITRLIEQQNGGIDTPAINRASLHATGDLVPLTVNNVPVIIPSFLVSVAFETNRTITAFAQLCLVPWLATYIDANFGAFRCPQASQLSYTPNMPNVLHAAMADTFHRGIGIGESRFAFSGRHNGDDRAAGFTYNFDTFALRTDYIRLPSKQDGEVFLDTFRFGILRPINDEMRFFAGVDSYRNAIFAIDTNGENLHRFGIAAGDGYAARYEYRIRL